MKYINANNEMLMAFYELVIGNVISFEDVSMDYKVAILNEMHST